MSTANLPSSIAHRVEDLGGLKRNDRFSKRPVRRPTNTAQLPATVIVIVAGTANDKETIARDLHSALSQWLEGTGDFAVGTTGESRPAGGTRDEETLVYDDLTINRDRREVRVGQISVELTKTEFDFLYHLASHPGIVLARSEIVDSCKGVDYPVTMRSVDVQVASLRRKLGPAAKHLQTLRGVGYRWVSESLGLSLARKNEERSH